MKSVIVCPCGHDCFAGCEEEDRHFAEETLHWKRAELVREAEKLGGFVADYVRHGIATSQESMRKAQVHFIERVLRRKIE